MKLQNYVFCLHFPQHNRLLPTTQYTQGQSSGGPRARDRVPSEQVGKSAMTFICTAAAAGCWYFTADDGNGEEDDEEEEEEDDEIARLNKIMTNIAFAVLSA